METTLNKIREHSPCAHGWKKLLTHLGKTEADDEPLSLLTILDSNGVDDALWCLRAVEGRDREIRLFAVWCARQAQHLTGDHRIVDALDVVERYANGEATAAELAAAGDTARDAARAAVRAARAAAYDVAGTAAACAAAWDAEAAARAAACAAAGDAACAVAAAAWAAARAAAAEATRAAAVWDVAWDDARAKQEVELRRICVEG